MMTYYGLDGVESAATTMSERTAPSAEVSREGARKSSLSDWLKEAGDQLPSCPYRPDISNVQQGHENDHLGVDDIIYVNFDEGDPRNPLNFSRGRKWGIMATLCLCAVIAATTAPSFSLGIESMMEDLHCSRFQALIAFIGFTIGFGLCPLIVAPFSEDFGRQPIYMVSALGLLLSLLMAALAKNIATVIVARTLQGIFASPGATMVGGSIADIFLPHERGFPMSLFVFIGFCFTGLGPVYSGWIALNPHLGWRWIQWVEMILCVVYLAALPLLKETRSSVLLMRMSKQKRKETGDMRYRARCEIEMESLGKRIYISCTRPIHLLATEPVVISMALWVGLSWGIVFCLVASITPIFHMLHGFNIGQTGLAYLPISIGSIFGFLSNMYQERLYKKYEERRGPEARLHTCCLAALLIPAGMLIFAWTSFPQINWIAQAIGLTIFSWGTFVIYLAAFTYVADCYGIYASSALAGQGLARNITATAFPLFTDALFAKLGYQWGNTLFALLAAVMIPIPFVLYFRGHWIRSKSKFSRKAMEAQNAIQRERVGKQSR